MAKPLLRYLPAKLKPLGAPTVWIPLTIFALLSVLLLEYYQHPEWFNPDPIINANPESDLTPDEQAKLSEIDTVDLLLKGAQVSSPLSSSLDSPKTASDDTSDGSNSVDSAAETAKGDRQLANRRDPFGAYASEYKLSGASRSNLGASNSPASQNATPNNGSSSFGSAAGNPPLATNPSALSEAIDRQAAIKANEAQRNGDSTSPSLLLQPSSTSTLENFSQSGLSSSSVQAPGNISVPFIRTTPAMSPPVGTTGYQAPSTSNLPNFNLAPTPPTRNQSAAPFPSGSIPPGQIGTVQPPPIARPTQSNQTPAVGTVYTAPRSAQPDQNRRAR